MIEGLVVAEVRSIPDDRGVVREFFRRSVWGLSVEQINVTESRQGVLRGLHGEAMTKLVGVAYGSALGGYVDTRPGSPTYGAVQTVELVPGVQVLVPAGVCNGFQTLSELSVYVYGFDAEWAPGMPGTAVHPLSVGIDWPLPPVLSEKDAGLPGLPA